MFKETLRDYRSELGDVYDQLEAMGSKVSWYPQRGEAYTITPTYNQFEGHDLEDVAVSVDSIAPYILMPAIEDDFPNDIERHAWLADKDAAINKAYADNRLRRNKIGGAKLGINLLSGVFKRNSDPRYDQFERIHSRISELLKNEDQFRTSVYFADAMADASLQVLRLLV